MFGLNAGAVSVNMVDSHDMVAISIEEVYSSFGVILGEGVSFADAVSYALGNMPGDEASEFRKELEKKAGASSEEDLSALYDKLERMRRFVRRIPGSLRCV